MGNLCSGPCSKCKPDPNNRAYTGLIGAVVRFTFFHTEKKHEDCFHAMLDDNYKNEHLNINDVSPETGKTALYILIEGNTGPPRPDCVKSLLAKQNVDVNIIVRNPKKGRPTNVHGPDGVQVIYPKDNPGYNALWVALEWSCGIHSVYEDDREEDRFKGFQCLKLLLECPTLADPQLAGLAPMVNFLAKRYDSRGKKYTAQELRDIFKSMDAPPEHTLKAKKFDEGRPRQDEIRADGVQTEAEYEKSEQERQEWNAKWGAVRETVDGLTEPML